MVRLCILHSSFLCPTLYFTLEASRLPRSSHYVINLAQHEGYEHEGVLRQVQS
jgi:hypothetical protein